MTATVPGGYFFTTCPGEASTPTLGSTDTTASTSVTVPSGGPGTGTFYVVPFSSATCTGVIGGVQCQLPDALGLPVFPLSTLIDEADTVDPTISSSTPMAITAFGGAGGSGDPAPGSTNHGGAGGSGGMAQTATTAAKYEATYGTPELFYYLGYQGIGNGQFGDKVGGLGGASTIVSTSNLTKVSPTISGYDNATSTNVLLVAAGGGGGGEGGVSDSGGHGGSGTSTVATTSASEMGTGATGDGTNGGGGHAGHGAGNGNGASAGAGGDGASPKYGTPGEDGIGGVGGSVHTPSGPSGSIPWANVGYLNTICNTSSCRNSGETNSGSTNLGGGGEGEWRGTGFDVGGGGGGGGGFGGGGGGGGGGATDAGGGGGAGGNFALQAVIAPGSFANPTNAGGVGQVYVTFVTS